ncbi:MAG: magnesium/cobalt transporter CorA, partial [Bacteroidia bacterium]|nr:magnesium/cobalt transporter CorA [Bacteroidia bacterium]
MLKQLHRLKPTLRRTKSRLAEKAGMPPETLVHIGEQKVANVKVEVMDYDAERLEEIEVGKVHECFTYKNSKSVTWIAVEGLHDIEIIKSICDCYNVHPLIQEDILNTQQRTKIEEFGDFLFVTFKNINYSENNENIETEQVSVILGQNFLLSFQEGPSKLFDEIKSRIRTGKGTIRTRNADYLLYKIMDAAVDQYFVMVDKIGETTENIEEETLYYPNSRTLYKIQNIKKDLMLLSKHILPMREALNKLEGGTSGLIEERSINYFRDVYDHSFQANETVESYRNILTDLLSIYLTNMSNKLNQVMKVLTIISTIFMPLSFLAGVYGMNFRYLPELN